MAGLTYPVGRRPGPGEAQKVAPGIAWLRMPMPMALDHVNLWLLDTGDGHVAVDAGLSHEAVRAAWRTILPGHRLTGLLVTHHHPDHLGLAPWLMAEAGLDRFWMTARAHEAGSALAADLNAPADPYEAWYRDGGLPDALLELLASRRALYARAVPPPPAAFTPLGDDIRIGARRWRVLVLDGHAAGHACLFDPEGPTLIAGDQVLPEISPNVSVGPTDANRDPLQAYLASLDVLAALPADTLVLPGHGPPFRGLPDRCRALHAHHAERLQSLADLCAATPATVLEAMLALFPQALDPHQTIFAFGEARAHLDHLLAKGRLRQWRDGAVLRYGGP